MYNKYMLPLYFLVPMLSLYADLCAFFHLSTTDNVNSMKTVIEITVCWCSYMSNISLKLNSYDIVKCSITVQN